MYTCLKKREKKCITRIDIVYTFTPKSTPNNDINVHTTTGNRNFYFFSSKKDPVDFHSKHKEEKENNQEKRRRRSRKKNTRALIDVQQ